MDKERIKRYFSEVAHDYDDLAHPQKGWANYLISNINLNGNLPFYILDIGMGTGRLTIELAEKFPQSEVFGCDIAFEMVSYAKKKALDSGLKRINLQQADFESLPYKDNYFDLVVSNASYQWALDIEKAFFELFRVLRREGSLYLTLLGEDSLKELKEGLKRIGVEVSSEHKLFNREKIKEIIKIEEWKNIKIEEKMEKINFKSVITGLRWLKSIGANYGMNIQGKGISKGRYLLKLEDIYKDGFSLSFEIFYIFAEGKY